MKRLNAMSGRNESLLVLLHGLGSNAENMYELVNLMSINLPHTKIIVPDAPHKSPANEKARQWFSAPAYDGSTHVELGLTLQESIDRLMATMDSEGTLIGIPVERQILCGFSQGAMIALHMAPRIEPQLCCVVSFAGIVLHPNSMEYETVARPPVLLAHDKRDDMIDFSFMEMAENIFRVQGFPVYTCKTNGFGHSVDMLSMGAAIHFIQRELGKHYEQAFSDE